MKSSNENISIVQDFLRLLSVDLNLEVFIRRYNDWEEFLRSLISKKIPLGIFLSIFYENHMEFNFATGNRRWDYDNMWGRTNEILAMGAP